MHVRSLATVLAFASASTFAAPQVAEARKVKIKVGTLAPEGSIWHNTLVRVAQRWKEASGGKVRLKIYPGGVAGDEGDMIRKMRIGQLHMGAMTGIGLQQITRSTLSLQLPMVFDSWSMLDHVRNQVADKMKADIESKGFVVLNWGDAGVVHLFSKTGAKTCADFKKTKYWVWSDDPESERAWRAAEFNPVPLSSSDVLSSLRTGMINAFGTTPIFALSAQWFGLTKTMVKVPWVYLNGAVVVTKKQWEKVDPELRPKLMQIAVEEGKALSDEVRKLHDKAIKAMTDRGLTVHTPTEAELAEWKTCAQNAYPTFRGGVVPAEFYDAVMTEAAAYTK